MFQAEDLVKGKGMYARITAESSSVAEVTGLESPKASRGKAQNSLALVACGV